MLTLAFARALDVEVYWIGPLIFLGVITLFWLIGARRWRKHGYAGYTHHGGWKSPGMRILEERYANGEIDRDEFFARKKDLQPPEKS